MESNCKICVQSLFQAGEKIMPWYWMRNQSVFNLFIQGFQLTLIINYSPMVIRFQAV